MPDRSKFHEHINDTGSDVRRPPSSLFATAARKLLPEDIRNRRWSAPVGGRTKELRQTDTLNCNGLAFRNTKFVPRPGQDMVEFFWCAGSRGDQPSGQKRRRSRTSATLASFAGFLFLPYALRKARKHTKERKKSKQEAENCRKVEEEAEEEEEENRNHAATFANSSSRGPDSRPSSSSFHTSSPESERLAAAGSPGEEEDYWETDTGTGSSVTMLERVNSDGRASHEGSGIRRNSSAILYGNWSRDLEAVVEEASNEMDSMGTPRLERTRWREV
ncbi:hypothetical protein BST61_g1421 [Cercospora zeina]